MAVIRIVPPSDPRLRDQLLRLGPEDRALRFGGVVSDRGVEGHCRRLVQAGRGALVLGAFAGGALVGSAELWFDAGPAPRGCEAAFAVDAPWRGRGIGTALLCRAVLVARNRWVKELRVVCMTENRRMQRLARGLADELRFRDGCAEAEIRLPFPSWTSLWAEAAMEAQAVAWPGLALPGLAPAPA